MGATQTVRTGAQLSEDELRSGTRPKGKRGTNRLDGQFVLAAAMTGVLVALAAFFIVFAPGG